MKATRLLPALAVAAALALAPGLALADPGNGRGNGITNGPNVPPGQSKKDTTVPQPPSVADFGGNGANVHGPYDSTRDGSPSRNGNGTGEATGKPCAGCVGKADNKNPRGQQPGGSDADSGYECDSNRGVGRGNPAHTGCKPAQTPPATPQQPVAEAVGAPPAPPAPQAAPAPAAAPEVAPEVAKDLAFTGFDLLPLGVAGLLLVGGGGAAVVMAGQSRRP